MQNKKNSKLKEITLYLLFGVIVTIVSLGTYYGMFILLRKSGVPLDDSTSATYITVYIVAQILQWVTGVLTAFFTNKKWVFTDADQNVSTWKQLSIFAAGRVGTFFLDLVLVYVGNLFFGLFFTDTFGWGLADKVLATLSLKANEFCSKLFVSILIVIINYILSKLFVFKDPREEAKEESNADD